MKISDLEQILYNQSNSTNIPSLQRDTPRTFDHPKLRNNASKTIGNASKAIGYCIIKNSVV